jgi:phage shock protein PspC (stress-responsive transcriptional regulator)
MMSNEYFTKIKSRWQLDRDNGWLFGVCAGLADFLRLDPALVRVGAIVTGLFMPKLVIACYLVAWLILDDKTGIRARD